MGEHSRAAAASGKPSVHAGLAVGDRDRYHRYTAAKRLQHYG